MIPKSFSFTMMGVILTLGLLWLTACNETVGFTRPTAVQATVMPSNLQLVTPIQTSLPISATPTVLPLSTRVVPKPKATIDPQQIVEAETFVTGEKIAETTHFEFYAENGYFPVAIDDFKTQAETTYDYVRNRLQLSTEKKILLTFRRPLNLTKLTFHRSSINTCPQRGGASSDLIYIYADEQTSQAQILGVLAHEVGHVLHAESDLADGTSALYEGLATWAAGNYWNNWHNSSSLDASVRDYLQQHTFLPLYENYEIYTSVGSGENCLARRDILYTEWAAFIDYLIAQYGWEKLHTLFGMPTSEERGSEIIIKPPDFQAVYGSSLNQLEAAWLENLATSR